MAFAALPAGQPGNWTIFDENGQPAVTFDVFVSCTVKAENRIAHSPVERGSFADYNKVGTPTMVGVVLARTGRSADLAATLLELESLAASTALVSVVTPERTYTDYNLESYDYGRKTENGVDRLVVSLALVEIRQVEPQYGNETLPVKNPKKADDTGTVEAGKQQAQPVEKSTFTRILEWGRR